MSVLKPLKKVAFKPISNLYELSVRSSIDIFIVQSISQSDRLDLILLEQILIPSDSHSIGKSN